jgi:hypothetical protein
MQKQKATAALPYNPRQDDALRLNIKIHHAAAGNNYFAK